MRTFLINILLTASFLSAFGQHKEQIPDSEVKEIKLAIDLPELQQYFHVDHFPSQIPIVIKEFGSINDKNLKGLQKI